MLGSFLPSLVSDRYQVYSVGGSRGRYPIKKNPLLLVRRPRKLVADGGAGGACARARGVRADHTRLIGVIHVLSGRGRGNG